MKGLTHLAQNKKKNAEVKNETVAFFLFNRFLPARGINRQLQGKKTVSASKCDNPFGMNQKFRMKNTAAG